MIGYPITYGDNLTQEEVNGRLKEVARGATLTISLYLLLTQAAHAADKTIEPGIPNAPKSCPASPVPGPPPGKEAKNLLAGLASVVCASGIQSSNFWIGVVCGFIILAVIEIATNE